MAPGPSFGSMWGGPLTAHLEAPQKRMGVSWGRKVIFQGCLKMKQQAG